MNLLNGAAEWDIKVWNVEEDLGFRQGTNGIQSNNSLNRRAERSPEFVPRKQLKHYVYVEKKQQFESETDSGELRSVGK